MAVAEVEQLAKILQASISPVVLISGFGLLLLVTSNRMGRPIDRIWVLNEEIKKAAGAEKEILKKQIAILFRRAWLLRLAIAFNTIGILCISFIILLLFTTLTLNADFSNIIQILFIMGLLSLMSSLVAFLSDVSLTLKSLKIQIKENLK